MEDLNDVFSMCALNCYDTSIIRQKAAKQAILSPSKKSAAESSKTFFFGGKTGVTGNRAKNHSEFDKNNDNNSILNL